MIGFMTLCCENSINFLEFLEQLANFRVPSGGPEFRAFPDTVFGEHRGDSFRVVIVVTDFAVSGLELFYGLDVFHANQPPLDIRKIHARSSILALSVPGARD
jgi:hypothetical protein